MSRLLEFRDTTKLGATHKCWTVYAKPTETILGSIHWYLPTKRYVFQTIFQWCYFDSAALGAITTFMRDQDAIYGFSSDVPIQDGPPNDLEIQ